VQRRDFIALAGGAAAWPLAAHAQQAMPVIGFVDSRMPDSMASRLRGLRQGLKETGFVEGENVTIVYRWAENQGDRLPTLAADLVRQRVAVVISSGGPGVAFAAKAATKTIPVVFLSAEDPVRLGLVSSLARPGGNLTGINFLSRELAAKQLELLRELAPAAKHVGALVNPANPTNAESTLKDLEPASRALGLQVRIHNASTSGELDTAFGTMTRERPDALFVGTDPFFNARRVQLALLAGRLGIPTIYSGREYAEAGGLMSYGSDIVDSYRQVGVYVGRILKGTKAADLPIVQASKFEMVINHQTARMLGLTVPQTLLTAADEVIE
jgi:putative ABC transport system substrate-binding protein